MAPEEPGRFAIVTGGAGGIGEAVVRRLRADGFRVIAVDRLRIASDDPSVLPIIGDAGNPDVMDEAFAIAGDARNVQALVNAIGHREYCSFANIDTEFFATHVETNVTIPMLWMSRVVNGWLRDNVEGAIVNVTSVMAERLAPENAAYAASKAALLALSKGAALDLAGSNIRVNCVAPGPTDTAMLEVITGDPQKLNALLARIPMGRLGQGQDVAEIVSFLISDKSDFITGSSVVVDGGYLIV